MARATGWRRRALPAGAEVFCYHQLLVRSLFPYGRGKSHYFSHTGGIHGGSTRSVWNAAQRRYRIGSHEICSHDNRLRPDQFVGSGVSGQRHCVETGRLCRTSAGTLREVFASSGRKKVRRKPVSEGQERTTYRLNSTPRTETASPESDDNRASS